MGDEEREKKVQVFIVSICVRMFLSYTLVYVCSIWKYRINRNTLCLILFLSTVTSHREY